MKSQASMKEETASRISVVVPVFNETAILPELLKRLAMVLNSLPFSYEIIFVDDGSSDHTAALIRTEAEKNNHIRLISFSRNFGHQSAVTAGIEHAQGDAVVIMDGDLQDPPEVIPEMIALWKKGNDIVYAVRKKRKEWWGKRLAYFTFYRFLRSISSGMDLPHDSGDFSLISRRAKEALVSLPERNRYVRGLRSWIGFSHIGLPYERDARYAGTTKYSLRKLFQLAYDGIFSFSYVPLRAITIIGFIGAAGSFVSILVVIYLRLFTTLSIPGFASLATIVLFLGGIQMMSLGIVGEYIRRIYDETKQRPNYIIKDMVGFRDQ